MYAALDPVEYKSSPVAFPQSLNSLISELLKIRHKACDNASVAVERNRILRLASNTLKAHHLLHLHLAARLMTMPLTTADIERIKGVVEDYEHAA